MAAKTGKPYEILTQVVFQSIVGVRQRIVNFEGTADGHYGRYRNCIKGT